MTSPFAPPPSEGRTALVQFTGTRSELFGILIRGYLLMVPTIGVYRFWMTTWKRRFYWHHTIIDGDPLEYTGNAMQLLVGFLFALAFFLPIYIAFFYLSTQTSDVAGVGYAIVAVVLWYLMGYAIYRARDFRLSRTLWRGVRFDQKGSAWGYASRRFAWSLMMVLTAGLVYPFMVGNLYRYRYSNTWYGNRQFSFSGSWKRVAGPFYLAYFGVVILIVATLAVIGATSGVRTSGMWIPGTPVWIMAFVTGLALFLGIYYYKARVTSRMLSSVRVGEAALTVRVRARVLVGQVLLYCLSLAGAAIALSLVLGTAVGGIFLSLVGDGSLDMADLGSILQTSWVSVVVLIVLYLVGIGTLALFGELILGYGFWAVVARGAAISNPDSLRSVQATEEDLALHGEGLADALNVGAY